MLSRTLAPHHLDLEESLEVTVTQRPLEPRDSGYTEPQSSCIAQADPVAARVQVEWGCGQLGLY